MQACCSGHRLTPPRDLELEETIRRWRRQGVVSTTFRTLRSSCEHVESRLNVALYRLAQRVRYFIHTTCVCSKLKPYFVHAGPPTNRAWDTCDFSYFSGVAAFMDIPKIVYWATLSLNEVRTIVNNPSKQGKGFVICHYTAKKRHVLWSRFSVCLTSLVSTDLSVM